MKSANRDTVHTSALLDSRDRCDRCGAQAYVEVRLSSGSLLFCAHHYGQFEIPLGSLSAAVHDERDRLRAVS